MEKLFHPFWWHWWRCWEMSCLKLHPSIRNLLKFGLNENEHFPRKQHGGNRSYTASSNSPWGCHPCLQKGTQGWAQLNQPQIFSHSTSTASLQGVRMRYYFKNGGKNTKPDRNLVSPHLSSTALCWALQTPSTALDHLPQSWALQELSLVVLDEWGRSQLLQIHFRLCKVRKIVAIQY